LRQSGTNPAQSKKSGHKGRSAPNYMEVPSATSTCLTVT